MNTQADDTIAARFLERVFILTYDRGCWIWIGGTQGTYGMLRRIMAHRLSWTLYRGPIPGGLCVCHHCDNPLCVNPDHLFLGTIADNARDMVAKNRQARGEDHGMAKLTWAKAEKIRSLYKSGISGLVLARMFQVSHVVIYRITKDRAWRSPFI